MEKIFIATTTYCKHSLEPLNLLKSHGFHVDTNEKGRKLTDDEISDTVSQYDGIIAGTESYSENILNHAKQLKVISDKQRIRPKKSEVNRLISKNSKAKRLIKWKPMYSGIKGFEKGIREMCQWFIINRKKFKSKVYNV